MSKNTTTTSDKRNYIVVIGHKLAALLNANGIPLYPFSKMNIKHTKLKKNGGFLYILTQDSIELESKIINALELSNKNDDFGEFILECKGFKMSDKDMLLPPSFMYRQKTIGITYYHHCDHGITTKSKSKSYSLFKSFLILVLFTLLSFSCAMLYMIIVIM